MLCAICNENDATQKHHIRYEPEITIDVCVPCHKRLHNYEVGVGAGRRSLPRSSQRELDDIKLPPFKDQKFHYITKENRVYSKGTFEVPIYRSKLTKEELDSIVCSYCEKTIWGLFLEKSTNKMYIICLSCGCDLEVQRIG